MLIPVAVGLIALLVIGTGAAITAGSARRVLEEANVALERGRADLLGGDPGAARAAFAEARDRFASARDVASNAWFGAMGSVPIVGRSVDAVEAISEAGSHVANAGILLAEGVEDLPDGLDSLAPVDGRVPIEHLERLAAAADAAREETAEALSRIERSSSGFLLGPVGPARAEAEEEIRSLHDTVDRGADLLEGLPTFLGGQGPRRYFFAAQNPAELRGTGGVMGAYSILTIEDGRFAFSRFEPVQNLPVPALSDVPPPTIEFAANYDEFRSDRRFWLAINLTPDFPTAAQAILTAYEVAEGARLDGVIMADPFALQALLSVTGPTVVPRLDTTIDAADVVGFTGNEAYRVYPDPATRKRVLGDVARAVFTGFLSRGENDFADLRVLAQAAVDGHVIAYSVDPVMQEALSGTGAGAALRTDGGDFFSVVENSAGGTKVDFFEDRVIAYHVDLWSDGAAEGSASLELTNDAPTSGQPAYVVGPNPGFARLGEDSQLVTLYCRTCQLEEARRGGERIGVETGTERGLTYYRDYFRTPRGSTSRLETTWYIPEAWVGDGTGGTYRLTILGQNTIRPTELEFSVTAPDGMHIVSASPEMRIEGETAFYEGVSKRRLDVEVTFQPPLLVRLWRAVTT